VFLASSPVAEGVTGKYFFQCKAMEPSLEAQDDAVGAWLWAQSVKLASADERVA